MGFNMISFGRNDDVILEKSKIDLHFIKTYLINANELVTFLYREWHTEWENEHKKNAT